MKYLIGFFVSTLVLAAGPMTVRQLEAGLVDEPQPANTRVNHDITAENQPVLWILQDVLRGTGVPGGFAEIAICSDVPKGRLELKQGTTIREAMDAFIAANPSYQWRLQGGVVNLMPRDDVPLLDTMIVKFDRDATDREIPAVLQDLLSLHEVQERAAALGLQTGLGQGGPGVVEEHPAPKEPAPFHISVRNVLLRDAFNEVVQTSGKGVVWIYHQTDCNGEKTYILEVSDYQWGRPRPEDFHSCAKS
jgi:hypothetical protein